MTAVPDNAVSRVIGIETQFVNLRGAVKYLPIRIAVVGQGTTALNSSYTTTKEIVTSAKYVGDNYGYGSPLHLAVKELLPPNGGGVGIIPVTIFPLKDDVSGVAETATITPTGTSQNTQKSYYIKVNNIRSKAFTLDVGDDVADACDKIVIAMNAVLDMPVIASDGTTKVDLVAKWKGASSGNLVVEVVGTEDGIAFATAIGGVAAVNPDVTTALNQIGNIWESFILNCMEIDDTDTLDLFEDFFEPRWGATVRKPGIVFTGTNEASQATAIVIPEARKAERINCQLVAPGSDNLPFVIAAAELAKIATIANSNPPMDYAGQQCTSLTPGTDAEQWDYIAREAAVIGGSSTIEVVDNVIELSDTIMFYHPSGEEPPAYRFVNDIVKVWQVLYNLSLIFEADEWKGAPLIPDDQATVNPRAKKPKSAKTAIYGMLDSLALEAIISDPETAKSTVVAAIDDTNPRRLNVTFTYQISGNTGIISVTANWGFYFGTQSIVEV